ncbi:Brain-enriched guanylate kinase-associated protein [Orchesella cincta]|uniref:Brain-enriched guanylate kinase-associated protein n=1 Tax=Orchesella cincta TaxID=48709 RepID=A0A1D2M8F7_ORCCI|nr:Brain-enriched guanylate kinase-associated protein [Orchesella cincta]
MRDMGKKLTYKEVWTFVQQLYEGQQELEFVTAKLQRLRVGQMTKLKQNQKTKKVFQQQLQEAELRKIMLEENKKLDEDVLLGRHADELRIMEDRASEISKLAAFKKNKTDEELLTMKKEIIEKH